MKRTASQFLLQVVAPPLATFAIVLVLWHLATVVLSIKAYILPSPLAVARAAIDKRGELLGATMLTARGALAGLGMSLWVGLLVSFIFSQSRVVQRSFYPYAIFLQTVPIVAIAPLMIIWFGYGFLSVALIAFIISLFPIITNGTAGLTDLDPNLLELFELNNASRWQVLFKLRLPNAIPYLANGVKISSGLSVIGAIIGEFFSSYGKDRYGLGYIIYTATGRLNTDYLFAAIFASTLLGLVIFGCASLAGRWIVRNWKAL